MQPLQSEPEGSTSLAERRFTVIDDHGAEASPQSSRDPGRVPRILVDGLDLSGKTTLTRAIIAALAERGIHAQRHRGMLAEHHPLEQWLHRRFPLVRQPESGAVTTAWLAGFALDGLLSRVDPPRPAGTVMVQDGYADRTVAFGMAGGPYLAACLALRWPRVFASFDLAVYLHAPAEARAARLAVRQDPDANDVRTVRDTAFAEAFTAMLVRGMGRRHQRLLVFDTSQYSPEEMAATVIGELLDGRRADASPLQDRSAGRAA
jgi:thymidylate kinase